MNTATKLFGIVFESGPGLRHAAGQFATTTSLEPQRGEKVTPRDPNPLLKFTGDSFVKVIVRKRYCVVAGVVARYRYH